MGVNNLSKVVTRQRDACSKLQSLSHQSDALATRLLSHPMFSREGLVWSIGLGLGLILGLVGLGFKFVPTPHPRGVCNACEKLSIATSAPH